MGYVVIPLLLQLGLMCSLCLLLQAQLIVMSHLSQHHLILLSLSNLQQNCKCTQYFSASGNWCTSEHWPADSLCALISWDTAHVVGKFGGLVHGGVMSR